ncbi:MAG: dephospho-CoA kinase [Solirubrobacterales bacterium]
MLKVGLTGGIACGKSHVLRRLAERGLPTLDLDSVGHQLLEPEGAAYAEVVAAFGEGILGADRRVDRKALGRHVFGDERARERLNAIVHPKVRDEEARRAAAHAAGGRTVFVTDAALLVEAGVHLRFDRLVVVHCSPEEQLGRLMERDGLPIEGARARLLAQMPIEEKRRFGHWQIDTSGPLEATYRGADVLADELLALAASPRGPAPLPIERALGLLALGPARGPRGLDPVLLLETIVEAGGLDMERIALRLDPPGKGPWYRRGLAVEPGPETLVGPLVLWTLAQVGPDPAFLLSAAASLALLTHGDPVSAAGAGVVALALLEAAVRGLRREDLASRLALWEAQAEAWCDAPPPERIRSVVRLALEPESLLGLARGVPSDAAPVAARNAVEGLSLRAPR